VALEVTLFTDPACPFAFSAEPVRQRLRWHYGDQLTWRPRMIVLTSRRPSAAARALDHKLGGPPDERRYSAPSYVITREDGIAVAIPGFNPIEAYEVAIANLAPELVRRGRPAHVAEVVAWADEPLATAEVALIAELTFATARSALSAIAQAQPAGADCYWGG
jgi:hypothetical protein